MQIGGFYIDYISLVYIILLIIFFFSGLFKGLFAVIFGVLKGLVAIVASYLLTKPVTNLVCDKTNITNGVSDRVLEWMTSKGESFSQVVTQENLTETLSGCLTELKIPSMLHKSIGKLAEKYLTVGNEQSIGSLLTNAIIYLAVSALVFIILLIIIRIILSILQNLFKNINRVPVLGGVNRLLGAALNVAFCVVIIFCISWGLTFIITLPGSVSDFLTEQMKLNEEGFTLSKWFFEHVNWAIELLLSGI